MNPATSLFVPGQGSAVGKDVLPDRVFTQALRAQVIRSLGDQLYLLSVRGEPIPAHSPIPLQTGDRLSVKVIHDEQGNASLRVLGRLNDESATPVSTSRGEARATAAPLPLKLETGPAVTSGTAEWGAGPNQLLAGLARAGGAIDQLVTQRPDLAGRLDSLLRLSTKRQESIGGRIEALVRELNAIFGPRTQAAPATASLIDALGQQLIGNRSFAQPNELAVNLHDRMASWTKGLETVLKEVASSDPPASPNLSAPANTSPVKSATIVLPDAIEAEGARATNVDINRLLPKALAASVPQIDVHAPPPETTPKTLRNAILDPLLPSGIKQEVPRPATTLSPSPSAEAPLASRQQTEETFPATIASDLKGQLLLLRRQIASLSERVSSSTEVQRALAQVDLLVDRLTGQQVRNLEGLNQYVQVEIPVHPRTGIEQARLQVFYRKQGGANSAADDRFTVAIFLTLSRLGDVLATVTGIDDAVSISIGVADEAAFSFLDHAAVELRKALVDAGYQGATVSIRRIEAKGKGNGADSVWDEFLETVLVEDAAGRRLDEEA